MGTSAISPRSEQFSDPLAFIRSEHDRQCEICDQLDDIVNALDPGTLARQAVSLRHFLTVDLPRHIEDEEVDLFPALSRRCQGVEGCEEILSQLRAEHDLDLGLVDPILRELEAIVESGAPQNQTRFFMNLRAFAETQRRHLLWENRVVLPLADVRLSAAEKRALGENMAARRGIRPAESRA